MSVFRMGGAVPGAPPPKQARRIERGTDQQEELWGRLVDGQSHILAEARAGCGKSSSSREGMFRMLDAQPRLAIRYAVFNSINATEFKEDCPARVDVGTIHSFGYAGLRALLRSRVEKNKSYLIMDAIPEAAKLPRWARKAVSTLVGHAKNQMLRPDQADLLMQFAGLVQRYDVRVFRLIDAIVSTAQLVLKRAAEMTDLVDFDDMIWLPSILGVEFPPCDVLFVDEAQDLNPAQHALLPLICPSGRFVIVGDRYQAIYSFRGADSASIPTMEKALAAASAGVEKLPLTVTFRCPRSHVALAKEYVPDLEAHSSNPEGEIQHDVPLDEAIGRLKPGAMLLCPRNAPLVGAALKMISQRVRVQVRGRAIGESLLDVLRSCQDPPTIPRLCADVDRWRNQEIARLSDRDGTEDLVEQTNDRAAGLLALAASCQSPAEIPGLVAQLFSDSVEAGAVILSTIHRAKGLEAEEIYYMDLPGKTPTREWEARQQANLHYVALTRSKRLLAFVIPNEKGI